MQTSDHKPFLICKGADSVIEALLNFSQGNEQRELFDETNKHVVKFA
jgi:magnesium-transporting ATPase (P-type)